MQVRDPIVGELDVLVGVVPYIPLAADPDHVGTELQLGRHEIVEATLDLVPRDAGDLLAGRDPIVAAAQFTMSARISIAPLPSKIALWVSTLAFRTLFGSSLGRTSNL